MKSPHWVPGRNFLDDPALYASKLSINFRRNRQNQSYFVNLFICRFYVKSYFWSVWRDLRKNSENGDRWISEPQNNVEQILQHLSRQWILLLCEISQDFFFVSMWRIFTEKKQLNRVVTHYIINQSFSEGRDH